MKRPLPLTLMSGDIEMRKLRKIVKDIFHPSVNKTLKSFRKKSNSLKKRIDFNVERINSNDSKIAHLQLCNILLNQEISQAEDAVEALGKITG